MSPVNAKIWPAGSGRPDVRTSGADAQEGMERERTGQNRAVTSPTAPTGPRPPRFPGGAKAFFGPEGVVTAATHRLPKALAADGWYHLMPFGEHPGVVEHPDGRIEDCTHVCDRAAFEAMLGNFAKLRAANLANDPEWHGLNVDADHLSHYDTAPSARYGFLTDLKIVGDGTDRAHGLYCAIDWTPLGKEAIEGRIYSFLSAVTRNRALGPGRYSPGLLTDACVTNQPQLPVRAMNRAPQGEFVFARCRSSLSAPGRGDQGGKTETPAPAGTKEKPNMDFKALLIRLLGLADTATEPEIQAAVDAMGAETMDKIKAKCRDLQKKNDELSRGVEADAFCDTHKAIIKDRASVRARYIADPEGVKATFAGLQVLPAEGGPRSLHRGRTPAAGAETEKPSDDPRVLARQQQTLVDQIAKRDGCSPSVAFNRARQERSDLFPNARQSVPQAE